MQVLLADSSGFQADGLSSSGSIPLSISRWQASQQEGVTAERHMRFT
jgi:hypothetical protein